MTLKEMTNQVIQGDCLEVMKNIPDKSIDLVLTDPPYGIGADKGVGGGFGVRNDLAKKYTDNWDNAIPKKEYFDEIIRISKLQIIFGGQFFTELLPPNGHWLVWDKVSDIKFCNPYGDCELAWTNINRKSVKKYTVIQQGFVSEERDKFHPTQKPVKLFKMILSDYSKETDLIIDPFLGSGTTAVAAMALKRNFIGIEISPEYCEIARQRLRQGVLL